jgi:hypothetical protein
MLDAAHEDIATQESPVGKQQVDYGNENWLIMQIIVREADRLIVAPSTAPTTAAGTPDGI